MLRYLITDLDGTLFDTRQANVEAYLRAFEKVGSPINREDYQSNFGLRFDALTEQLAPHLTNDERERVKSLKGRYYQEMVALVRPNQPLIDFLVAMHPTHPIGLATTASRHNAEFLIEYFGLQGLFDAAIYGEDVSRGKPDSECYTKCIELLGGKPRETLIFEDSAVGIAAAEAAGAHVMQVTLDEK